MRAMNLPREMRGLLWDDLDSGTEIAPVTEKLIRQWEEEFSKLGVVLVHCKDPNDFFGRFLSEKFDFVMIDLFDGLGRGVGLDYARRIRDEVQRGNPEDPDPDFPVFVVSRDIDEAKITELDRINVTAISKSLQPALVVHTVRSTLHPMGRWIANNSVFIIARDALRNEAGTVHADSNLADLCSMVKRADLNPVRIAIGDNLGIDALAQIKSSILTARKVIALLTADEPINSAHGAITHVARPNVYLELGLVGAQQSTLRKTLLLHAANVLFPSDFGGRPPRKFIVSIREVEDAIYGFLKSE
jgi:DNA-binding NarL/FixJ family response regulator